MTEPARIGRAVVLASLVAMAACSSSGDSSPPGGGSAPVGDIQVTDSLAPAGDGTLAFGSVTTGTTADATVTITNIGSLDLLLGPVPNANRLAAPFSITSNGCSEALLAPAETCTLSVRFAPTGAATYSDAFDIPSGDPETPVVTVTLGGVGTALPGKVIRVDDGRYPYDDLITGFGNVAEVTPGYPITIKVSNIGSEPVTFGVIGSGDPLSPPFSLVGAFRDNCSGRTVGPGAYCVFDVAFSPAEIGSFTDSVDIPADADAGPVTVTLTGLGVKNTTPRVRIADLETGAPNALPFGEIPAGLETLRAVAITNFGGGTLTITRWPTPLAPFSNVHSGTCSSRYGAGIPAGVTCTANFLFAPSTTAAFTGALAFETNDTYSPTVTVTATGAGVASVTPALSLPRTGQTACWDAAGSAETCAADGVAWCHAFGTGYFACPGSQQDGALLAGVSWPASRFTAGLDAEADCITDELTGLMWPKDGDIGLGKVTWQGALDWVKSVNVAAGLCGHHDWRLPNRNELRSLLNVGVAVMADWLNDPAQGFLNVRSDAYWTSNSPADATSYSGSRYSAVTVNFGTGGIGSGMLKTGANGFAWPVRTASAGLATAVPKTGQTGCFDASGAVPCVGSGHDGELRAGAAWPSNRLLRRTSEWESTIFDSLTGLTWLQEAYTPQADSSGMGTCAQGAKSWQGARDWLACLNAWNAQGRSDWRLPTVAELQSLVHMGDKEYLELHGFYVPSEVGMTLFTYWTSDTRVASPGTAWVVNPITGDQGAASKTTDGVYRVLPVAGP